MSARLPVRRSGVLWCWGAVWLMAVMPLNSAGQAEACTSFMMRNAKQTLMGKSYDWHTAAGLLMVNKRGVQKRAFLLQPGYKGHSWKSLYGSITFNQYGREMPLGGMNEKGLAIEVLWLNQTRYPALQRGKSAVSELQWIQYLLDTSANVDEVVQRAKQIQIAKAYAHVHYMACDKRGVCATFEFLQGKAVVHYKRKLPFAALTNNTYQQSMTYARDYKGLGGKRSLPGGAGSLSRFCRAAAYVSAKGHKVSVKHAFGLLANVRMGRYTKWHIVYELKRGKIHFRSLDRPKIITISMAKQAFQCKTPVRVMDMRGTVIKGQKSPRWVAYKTVYNKRLIKRSLDKLVSSMGGGFPPQIINALATYPTRATRCQP